MINIDFSTSNLSGAISTLQQFYPSEEFTVFHGSELIYEKSEMLDEDEVENYERNIKKSFKELTNAGQLQLIVEIDGGPAVKAYFLDSPGLKEPCLEQMIGNTYQKTDFEKFMVASNIKQKSLIKRTVDPKLVALQAQASCADISDSEEVIEETKESQKKKMDIEVCDNLDGGLEEVNKMAIER